MTEQQLAAMRQALEALEYYQIAGLATTRVVDSITALRQAISDSVEQPAQQSAERVEPVDWEAVAADQAMTIALLKSEDAAPVQEPVAWINAEKRTFEWNGPMLWNTPTVAVLDKIPLYTTPPAARRQWVGLTDEEIELLNDCGDTDSYKFARAIEAKLKEKNIK